MVIYIVVLKLCTVTQTSSSIKGAKYSTPNVTNRIASCVQENFAEEKNVSSFLTTVSSKITMKNIDLNMNGRPVVLNIRD